MQYATSLMLLIAPLLLLPFNSASWLTAAEDINLPQPQHLRRQRQMQNNGDWEKAIPSSDLDPLLVLPKKDSAQRELRKHLFGSPGGEDKKDNHRDKSDEQRKKRSKKRSEDDEHEKSQRKNYRFKPPLLDSVRSVCPAFNTLANHGYINRDGKDINIEDVADALFEVFGYAKERAEAVFSGVIQQGLKVENVENMTLFNLDSLNYEYGFDLDAALYAEDYYFEPNQRFSNQLFQDLTKYCRSQNDGSQVCTLQDLSKWRIARYEETCKENPDGFKDSKTNPFFHIVMTNNNLFSMVLQSNSPEDFALDSTIDIADLRSFVQNNRLPNKFVSRIERGFEPFNPVMEAAFSPVYKELCMAAASLEPTCPSMPLCPPPPSP